MRSEEIGVLRRRYQSRAVSGRATHQLLGSLPIRFGVRGAVELDNR